VQADPATESLLHAGVSSEDSSVSGLQSGRYQAKPSTPDDEPVYKPKPKKKMNSKRPASVEPAVLAEVPEAAPQELPPKAVPGVGEQVVDILKGGTDRTGEVYREQIHPDDIRNNRVELDVGTGMIYNNSTANLAYRNYYSFAPSMNAGAHLWLTPLAGISAHYLSTYSETVPSTSALATSVNVKSEWAQLSFDFRKFFGMSRRANSLNYGLMYSQYKLNVSASEPTRPGLLTSGLGLYLNLRIPTAPSYAWTFGGDISPSLSHSETSTALNLQSGSSVQASRLGFALGGEFKLSRENQLIWSLGVKVEKDQFSGTSNLSDPSTGLTPTGVNVTNTWTYFNLGYRWGQ